MTQEEPIFVGYFPKITKPAPESIGGTGAEEICSVSQCISPGPENWIDYWKHNEKGFYDTEDLALEVTEERFSEYDIYAYKLFPLKCLNGKIEEIEIETQSGEISSSYKILGYDIVSNTTGNYFECSPLSCNYRAQEYKVNRYCLIDEKERAYKTMLEIEAKSLSEPGPYYLFEVYRKHA